MGNALSITPLPRAKRLSPEPWPVAVEQQSLLPQSSTTTHRKPTTRAKNRRGLLRVHQVPHWLHDEYILSGYRPPTGSVADCIASWTYLHNESGSIYTHMVPALCLVAGEILLCHRFKGSYPKATGVDQFVFAMYLLAALMCMAFSAGYHTLTCHSYSVSELWLRMDYVGIVGLIVGNILSGTYMIFYCTPNLLWPYWGATLALGSVSCIIILSPKFQGREWRLFRTTMFVCTGLSSLAPLAHATLIFGASEMFERSGLPYYFLEGLLYITGVIFYAIFHVLVVFATVAHIFGVWHAFDYHYYTHGLSC